MIFDTLSNLKDSFKREPITLNMDEMSAKSIINQFNDMKLGADAFIERSNLSDEALKSYFKTVKSGDASFVGYTTHIQNMSNAVGVMGVKAKVTTIAMNGLKLAMSIVGTMVLVTIIEKLIVGLDGLHNSAKEITRKADEAKQKIDDLTESFEQNKATVEDIKERYAELAQGVDLLSGKNISLSTDDYEEFLMLSNQLAEIFPTLIKNYDSNGNAILDLTGNINTIVNSLNNLIEAEQKIANQKILENLPNIYKDLNNEVSKYNNTIKNYNILDDILQKDFKINNHGRVSLMLKNDKDVLNSSMQTYLRKELNKRFKEEGLNANAEVEFNYAQSGYEVNISGLENTEKYYSKLKEIFTNIHEGIVEKIRDVNSSIKAEMDNFNTYLYTSLSTDFNFAQLESNSELQSAIQQIIFNSNWIDQLPDNIDQTNWNAVVEWIKDNYLDAIVNINDQEIINKITELFTNDLTPQTKVNLAQELQAYFDDNGIKIKLNFITDENNPNSEANLIQRKSASISDIASNPFEQQELYDYTKDFSNNQLSIWLGITNGAKSAEEAIARYEEKLKQITSEEDIKFLDDEGNIENINKYKDKISDLSSYLEKLNTTNKLSSEDMAYLNTTYGLTAENVEEYKIALLELIQETIVSSEIMTVLAEAITTCNDAAMKKQLQSLYDNLKGFGEEALLGANSLDNLGKSITNLKEKAQLLRDVNEAKNKLEYIDTDQLDEIITLYPQLEEKVARYNAGLITTEQLLEALTNAYNTDVKNYAIAVSEKMKYDSNYYEKVQQNIPSWLSALAESYGIDFGNYKNLCEAKLSLDKQYAQKKLQLDRANAELDDAYDKVENTSGSSRVDAEYAAQLAKQKQINAQRNLNNVQAIIDGVNTSLEATLNLDTSWQNFGNNGNSESGSDSDNNKQSIDWLEQSLTVLQAEVDKFQTALENTSGVDNQIKAIDKLNETLEDLKTGYNTAYSNYETRYNSALSLLSKKQQKSIKKKIESGEAFDLSEYDSETAEIIQEAIEAYNNMTETQVKIDDLARQINDNEYLEKSKYRQQDYEKQLDTVNSKLEDQTLEADKKNKLLNDRLELQTKINDELRKQAEYSGDYEAINKLNTEDRNNTLETKLQQIQSDQDNNQRYIDKYKTMLEDESLLINDITNINDKLQQATNQDFAYQMEAEIAKIDSSVWKNYIKTLKKKYKETNLSDKEFIKKHIEEIVNHFGNTDMTKIYQGYLNSEADFAETYYNTHKIARGYMIQDNENNITDIKNNIESKGGRGTKEQYEQMSKSYQSNLSYYLSQKKYAENMLKNTKRGTAEWDKWNTEIQECEDNIYKCNENIKDCYSSILKLPLNDIEDTLDNISDELDDIGDKMSDYDTYISAANVIIDDQIEGYELLKESVQSQIDALQEENELRESSLSIQQAEYNLQKSMNNKTLKIYKEDKGFVYEADTDEVKSAQQEYDSALYERKIFLLEQQSSLYDEEIEKLNEIKDKWSNIVSDIEDTMDINQALSYDSNFFKKVLEDDYSLLADISGNYRYLLETKSAYEEKQKSYEKLKNVIDDVVKKYEEESMAYEEARRRISSAIQIYYPEIYETYNVESNKLNRIMDQKITDAEVSERSNGKMLESYRIFSEEMNSIFDKLDKMLVTYRENTNSMVSSVRSSLSSLQGELQNTTNSVNTFTSANTGKRIGTGVILSHGIKEIGKSHSGIELGYLGESSTSKNKENFRVLALDELDNNELLRVLQKGEGVITNTQVNSVMNNFKNLAQVKIPTIPLHLQRTNQSVAFNGDIIVQGVQDVNGLSKAIKNQLPNAFFQELYRK